MKIILALMLSLLVGCSSFRVPGEVKIPIAVECKTPDPNQPTYRYNPPYDNVFNAVRDLLGDREAALGYEIELRAALKSCK